MKTLNIKKLKPVELTADEISVHLQTHEGELNYLTDRINTQLEMIENLQEEVKALENDLAEHRIKEMARDEFKQILEDGEVVVSLDHLIT
jgi:predicted  nucleic acid-binding Zn-ribbon protein